MRFSLILPTLNRYAEPKRFLWHLKSQTYKDYELIIVDQNNDDRIYQIMKDIEPNYAYKILRCEKGASRARNLGLRNIKGDIVVFPDDDCWYPEDLLDKASKLFVHNPTYDGISTRCSDEYGNDVVAKFDINNGLINRYNLRKRVLAVTIFLRKRVVESIGYFNENIGPNSGSIYGAGEEMDYIFRCINRGCKIYYCNSLIVHHPETFAKKPFFEKNELEKAYKYAVGSGRLLKIYYPFIFSMLVLANRIKELIVSLLFFRKGYIAMNSNILFGIFKGYITAKE